MRSPLPAAAPLLLLLMLVGCPETPRPSDDDDSTGLDDDDDSAPAGDDDDTTPPPDDDDVTEDPCAEDPPECFGICALHDPVCTPDGWDCTAPGIEATEVSCDGFDNDCDGEVDEGDVCPDCDYDLPAIDAQLHAIWDIDFDFQCNTYLTTMVSGPDWTTRVSPVDPVVTWYGNANQNMGFALVDPDPGNERVVVTYACCPSCGCLAANGLTLLYTCTPDDPGCGCIGQTNCPGFLDEPFLPAGLADTSVPYNGFAVSTPSGLAVGPRNSYFVGNFNPSGCSDETGCVDCGPDNPSVYCSTDQPHCCQDETLGSLVQFTLPNAAAVATWRVEAILAGEEILGLASGRDGSVMVGTDAGNLYRLDPVAGTTTAVGSWPGAVFSITQQRFTGDWYLEVRADPKLVRLAEDGTPLTLPSTVEANPPDDGVLQWAPDDRLYRLCGRIDATSTLDRYDL